MVIQIIFKMNYTVYNKHVFSHKNISLQETVAS